MSDDPTRGQYAWASEVQRLWTENAALRERIANGLALADARDHDRLLSGTTMAHEIRTALGGVAGPCTCGESVPTVTTPGPCYWAENAPGVESQVHCPPPVEGGKNG